MISGFTGSNYRGIVIYVFIFTCPALKIYQFWSVHVSSHQMIVPFCLFSAESALPSVEALGVLSDLCRMRYSIVNESRYVPTARLCNNLQYHVTLLFQWDLKFCFFVP